MEHIRRISHPESGSADHLDQLGGCSKWNWTISVLRISYCKPDENCIPSVPPFGTALATLELLLVSLSVHAVYRVGDSC
jgi:hypothetical protein